MACNIVLLTDDTGFFWSSHTGTRDNYSISSVDVNKIKKVLEDHNCCVEVYSFSTIPDGRDWKGVYIWYASSDKRGGFYKEYIEDVVLGLQIQGAVLIPDFKYFRAHENKNFAEILRKSFVNPKLQKPKSKTFGSLEELKTAPREKIEYPCVLKSSSGSGSSGVFLVQNEEELLKKAEKISAHSYYNYSYTYFRRFFEFGLGFEIKKIYHRLRGIKGHYELKKDCTNKFLIQEYIPSLQGDYKVLYFGGKYYLLYRKNRDNDFRASGSGKFTFPELTEESRKVLDFARECVQEIKTPLLSLDIGLTESACYLIEYQCTCFGTYTLEFSEFCFKYDTEKKEWYMMKEKPDLEKEMADAVLHFINTVRNS